MDCTNIDHASLHCFVIFCDQQYVRCLREENVFFFFFPQLFLNILGKDDYNMCISSVFLLPRENKNTHQAYF